MPSVRPCWRSTVSDKKRRFWVRGPVPWDTPTPFVVLDRGNGNHVCRAEATKEKAEEVANRLEAHWNV